MTPTTSQVVDDLREEVELYWDASLRDELAGDARYQEVWDQLAEFVKAGDKRSLKFAKERVRTIAAEKRVKIEWAAIEITAKVIERLARRLIG